MTWTKLAMIRFNQDTTDASAQAEQALSGEMAPVATGHDVAVKSRLLTLPDRQALVAAAGVHAVSLWEADVTAFDAAIADAVIEEARLATRQTELVATLRFRFRGETLTLQGLIGKLDSPDRTVRHDAHQALLEGVALQGGGGNWTASSTASCDCATAWPATSASRASPPWATGACARRTMGPRRWSGSATRS